MLQHATLKRVFGAEIEVGLGEYSGETKSDGGSFHTN